MLFLTEDRAFSRTCRLRGRYCQKESRGSFSITSSTRRWQTKIESVRRLFCDDKLTVDCTPSPFTTVRRTDEKDWRLWLYKKQLIKFDLVRRAASVWLSVRTAVYCYKMFFHLEFHQLQVTSRRSWITLLLIFLVLRFIYSRWHFSQRKSCQGPLPQSPTTAGSLTWQKFAMQVGEMLFCPTTSWILCSYA